jgi:hypothetical protein
VEFNGGYQKIIDAGRKDGSKFVDEMEKFDGIFDLVVVNP